MRSLCTHACFSRIAGPCRVIYRLCRLSMSKYSCYAPVATRIYANTSRLRPIRPLTHSIYTLEVCKRASSFLSYFRSRVHRLPVPSAHTVVPISCIVSVASRFRLCSLTRVTPSRPCASQPRRPLRPSFSLAPRLQRLANIICMRSEMASRMPGKSVIGLSLIKFCPSVSH